MKPEIRYPLADVHNTETGVTGYQPQIRLTLLRGDSTAITGLFILYSGASVSVMSLLLAEALGLSVPDPETEVVLAHRTAEAAAPVQRRVRPGRIRVSIPALRLDPFDWPCYFRPDLPKGARSLLGLAGVLEDLRITLDGVRSRGGVFFGTLLLEVRESAGSPSPA